MATQETVDKIVQYANEITSRDISGVVTNNKWGEYNFEECRDSLEAAYLLFALFKISPWLLYWSPTHTPSRRA